MPSADNLAEGQLLVASRDLRDPNFAETVIVLIHYDRDGAVGLVLNRRTDVPISRALKTMKAAEGRNDPVFLGGPVNRVGVLALLRSSTRPEGAKRIASGVYVLASEEQLQKMLATKAESAAARIYLGYAGWGPGQLESELDAGAWHILRGDAETVFDRDPDSLWTRLIRKTEVQLANLR